MWNFSFSVIFRNAIWHLILVSDIFIVYSVFFVSIFFDLIGEKLIFLTPWLSHEMLVRNVSFSENCVYVLNEWFLVSWFWILKKLLNAVLYDSCIFYRNHHTFANVFLNPMNLCFSRCPFPMSMSSFSKSFH